MNNKGEFNWFAILVGVPLIMFLIAIIPAIDALGQQYFTTLGTLTATYFINLIKLLVGGFGLLITIGVIWVVMSGLKSDIVAGG